MCEREKESIRQTNAKSKKTKIRNLISFSYFIGEAGDFVAWQGRQLYVSLVSCLYEFYLVFLFLLNILFFFLFLFSFWLILFTNLISYHYYFCVTFIPLSLLHNTYQHFCFLFIVAFTFIFVSN